MGIEYRELVTQEDFDQVSDFQRRVFGLSDLDLISPLQLKLVARNNPPMGIHLGVFSTDGDKSVMIGALLGFATFLEKSVYAVLMGVLPEYREGIYGYKLIVKYREVCLSRGIQTVFGVYDPLNPGLAKLYHAGMGFVGTEYLGDKLLFRWNLRDDPPLQNKDGRTADSIRGFPVAAGKSRPEASLVLFEIPQDYLELKACGNPRSEVYLEESRSVLSDYLNRRNYTVVDCFSPRSREGKSFYFVLKKPG